MNDFDCNESELREQIAREIEAKKDYWASDWNAGMQEAANIARGK